MRSLQTLSLIGAMLLTGCNGCGHLQCDSLQHARDYQRVRKHRSSHHNRLRRHDDVCDRGDVSPVASAWDSIHNQFLRERRESVRPEYIHQREFHAARVAPRSLQYRPGKDAGEHGEHQRGPPLRCSDVLLWVALKLFFAGV